MVLYRVFRYSFVNASCFSELWGFVSAWCFRVLVFSLGLGGLGQGAGVKGFGLCLIWGSDHL